MNGDPVRVTVGPAMVVITPYAMARFAKELFEAANQYRPIDGGFSLLKYFLLCASIEIGLKSAILALDCTSVSEGKIKALNHDLEKVIVSFEQSYDERIFDLHDFEAVKKVNPYYRKKRALMYFTEEMMDSALRGYKDMPAIGAVEAVAAKVQAFIVQNELFINASSSEGSAGGIIKFV